MKLVSMAHGGVLPETRRRRNRILANDVDHAGEGKGVEVMCILTAKLAGGSARSVAACGGRNRRRSSRGVVAVT